MTKQQVDKEIVLETMLQKIIDEGFAKRKSVFKQFLIKGEAIIKTSTNEEKRNKV
jgi:hypothetical protein